MMVTGILFYFLLVVHYFFCHFTELVTELHACYLCTNRDCSFCCWMGLLAVKMLFSGSLFYR